MNLLERYTQFKEDDNALWGDKQYTTFTDNIINEFYREKHKNPEFAPYHLSRIHLDFKPTNPIVSHVITYYIRYDRDGSGSDSFEIPFDRVCVNDFIAPIIAPHALINIAHTDNNIIVTEPNYDLEHLQSSLNPQVQNFLEGFKLATRSRTQKRLQEQLFTLAKLGNLLTVATNIDAFKDEFTYYAFNLYKEHYETRIQRMWTDPIYLTDFKSGVIQQKNFIIPVTFHTLTLGEDTFRKPDPDAPSIPKPVITAESSTKI